MRARTERNSQQEGRRRESPLLSMCCPESKSVPENEKEDLPDQAWGRGRARLGGPKREIASWSQGSGTRSEQRGGVGRELSEQLESPVRVQGKRARG